MLNKHFKKAFKKQIMDFYTGVVDFKMDKESWKFWGEFIAFYCLVVPFVAAFIGLVYYLNNN